MGDLIRFYHKEMEAYLVAEGLFDDELTEDGLSLKLLGFDMRESDFVAFN